MRLFHLWFEFSVRVLKSDQHQLSKLHFCINWFQPHSTPTAAVVGSSKYRLIKQNYRKSKYYFIWLLFSFTDRLSNLCNLESHLLNEEGGRKVGNQSKLTIYTITIHNKSLYSPFSLYYFPSPSLLFDFHFWFITIQHYWIHLPSNPWLLITFYFRHGLIHVGSSTRSNI